MLDIPFPKPLLISEARRLLQEFKSSLPQSRRNELDSPEVKLLEIMAANLIVALIDTVKDFSLPIYAREMTVEEMTAIGEFFGANEAVREAMALDLSTSVEGLIRCLSFVPDPTGRPAETIDAEKLALARRLVEVSAMITANPETLRACLVETVARGYARRMSVEAMKALIEFDTSPNGQRFGAVSLQVQTELASVIAASWKLFAVK